MSVPEASRLRVEEWSKKPVPRPAVLDENGEEEEDADVADGLADFLIDSDAEGCAVFTLLPYRCCHTFPLSWYTVVTLFLHYYSRRRRGCRSSIGSVCGGLRRNGLMREED
jgi:hypothetical protein